MNLAKASARAAAPAAKPETTPAAPRGTAESSGFAPALSRFNAYIRIECGLAAATREAYGRDLDDLVGDLVARGVTTPAAVEPAHLVEHVRFLSRERGLDPATIVRHVSTVRVFFRFLHASNLIAANPARLL